jgi:MtN3 and saliva related transmembrane protein
VEPVTLLGLAAAGCTTIAFLPQVVRNWRTRSVGDLSPSMFALFATGVLLWLVYGILIRNVPLVAANAVTLTLAVANLAQIAWYRRASRSGGG